MFKMLTMQIGLLLISSTVVGAAWTGLSLTQAPLTRVDLDRGAKLFQRRCAACHSLDPKSVGGMGPNLARIGAVAATRSPESGEAYLLRAIIDPAAERASGAQGVMPSDIASGLEPTDLLSLVGFLMEQGGRKDWKRLLALRDRARPPKARVEDAPREKIQDIEAGREIFLTKGKCGQCHALRKIPGGSLLAPDLLHVGRHDPTYLRESVFQPNKVVPDAYRQWSVRLEDGRVVSGRLLRSTASAIELLVAAGDRHSLRRIEREDIMEDDDGGPMLRTTSRSAMPESLASHLTTQEQDQLLAFLRTLK